MNTKEKEKRYFGRGSEAMDLEVERAKGSLIWDINGKRYIDFLGGAGVGHLGWANEVIEMSIRNAERPTYVYPNFRYEGWARLAELIAVVTPEHLTKSFRCTGGSEAIEAAMQMAMMYTGRRKFVSIEGSYHGNTIGALSIGASSNREKFHNLLPGCDKISLPLDDQALENLTELLGNNEVAAFVMEPVICNLGVIIPDQQFMTAVDRLCKEHGSLLVFDEAISGFGRTGKFFATEHFEAKPDIMILDKALSGGHAGIGAVVTTDKVANAVEGKIGLYSSFGWHPLSVEAAIASIRLLLENTEEIFENIESISELFRLELSKMTYQAEAEVRIKGLAIGIDVQDPDYASQIKQEGLLKGLLMNSESSTVTFLPALNINRDLVEEGLDIFKQLLK